jgi:hypothetical protein
MLHRTLSNDTKIKLGTLVASYSHSTCVKKKVCWASEIEWPVVKHSRKKYINIQGMFCKVETVRCGGPEESSSCHGMAMSKRNGFLQFLSRVTF